MASHLQCGQGDFTGVLEAFHALLACSFYFTNEILILFYIYVHQYVYILLKIIWLQDIACPVCYSDDYPRERNSRIHFFVINTTLAI